MSYTSFIIRKNNICHCDDMDSRPVLSAVFSYHLKLLSSSRNVRDLITHWRKGPVAIAAITEINLLMQYMSVKALQFADQIIIHLVRIYVYNLMITKIYWWWYYLCVQSCFNNGLCILKWSQQSGRSPKVVALFLLQTLVAIWYDYFNCMIQSKWNHFFVTK